MSGEGRAAADMTELDAVHREALGLWWEREATLPRFVRRAPEALDLATGAWDAVLVQAEREIALCPAPPTPPPLPGPRCTS